MNKEFDPYTRDDLISEVLALRLKYESEFSSLVIEATEKERNDLVNEKNSFLERTKDIVDSEIIKIIKEVSDLSGDKASLFYGNQRLCDAYSQLTNYLRPSRITPQKQKLGVTPLYWKWVRGKK